MGQQYCLLLLCLSLVGKSKRLLGGLVVHGLGELVSNGRRYFGLFFVGIILCYSSRMWWGLFLVAWSVQGHSAQAFSQAEDLPPF